MATWVTGQQVQLVDEVQKQVDAGTIEKYNVENPKPSLLGSILGDPAPVRADHRCCSCS